MAVDAAIKHSVSGSEIQSAFDIFAPMDEQLNPQKPKSLNREKGKAGEKMAVEYLLAKGYTIERLNWKGNGYEIDIIAKHNQTIVFVEVKARGGTFFGWPEKAVNKAKQQHISKAADHFIDLFKIENEIRFDIISIVTNRLQNEIYHIEDAFVP